MNDKDINVNNNSTFGCFGGCVIEILGFLVLVYIITHWSEIWQFVTN